MVSQFIYKNRNGKKTRVGIFLATVIDGELKIGHALCSKEDEFSLDYCLALAGLRTFFPDPCPPSIQAQRDELEKYCYEYFADELCPCAKYIVTVG